MSDIHAVNTLQIVIIANVRFLSKADINLLSQKSSFIMAEKIKRPKLFRIILSFTILAVYLPSQAQQDDTSLFAIDAGRYPGCL